MGKLKHDCINCHFLVEKDKYIDESTGDHSLLIGKDIRSKLRNKEYDFNKKK